jgi:hypothetical protein
MTYTEKKLDYFNKFPEYPHHNIYKGSWRFKPIPSNSGKVFGSSVDGEGKWEVVFGKGPEPAQTAEGEPVDLGGKKSSRITLSLTPKHEEREGSALSLTRSLTSQNRYCHACGLHYPLMTARFCCECGARRIDSPNVRSGAVTPTGKGPNSDLVLTLDKPSLDRHSSRSLSGRSTPSKATEAPKSGTTSPCNVDLSPSLFANATTTTAIAMPRMDSQGTLTPDFGPSWSELEGIKVAPTSPVPPAH